MENGNGHSERDRLHAQLIDQDDRPCWQCGGRDHREIHRIRPGCQGGEYKIDNVRVLCRACHLLRHPWSKFSVNDVVVLNGRTPAHVQLTRHSPRRIVAIRYDSQQLCNYYTLGSNGRGESKDGNPQDGFAMYEFRSYMLQPYQPRQYHYHRRYHRKAHRIQSNTFSCAANCGATTPRPDQPPTPAPPTRNFQGPRPKESKHGCTGPASPANTA